MFLEAFCLKEGTLMTKTKNIKKKTKASDTNQSNIIMIPIDKIKPCRWGTGIRDKEKFERLKESIKEHGLDDKPHVFPLKNGMFEIFIGDHRVMACRELGWKWKEILCIVENISEQEAEERCANNNFTHADYDSVRAENRVFEMWKSGRYKAKAQLGRKIGVSDTWIGLLIRAKELREKSKLSLDASISTRSILDTDLLQNENDKIALLKLVKDKKIKQGDIKEYAETLPKLTEDERRCVLYEGKPLSSIATGNQSKISRSMPKKTYSKTLVVSDNFLLDIYKLLTSVQNHVALIKDDDKKKTAINYVKFYSSIFLQILCKEGKISEDFFKSVVRNELKIDDEKIYHFDGLNTRGVDWWFDKSKENDDEEIFDKTKTLKLNLKECTGCNLCIDNCPNHVFEEINHTPVIVHPENCKKCGLCIQNCPGGCITESVE